MDKKISICTTNYNCAHALERHLESVYSQLNEDMFEYILVDNKSKDDSPKILEEFEKKHENFTLLSEKCTMGRGREIAFAQSKYDYIMVIDTDTVYFPIFKDFVKMYFEKYSDIVVQALFCGIFPRNIWIEIGGRRDLNIYEDLDMWIRIWKLGKIKWYPVIIGENIKDAAASWEFKSKRYNKFEKIRRFIRREYDTWRQPEIYKIDLKKMYRENLVDLGLGEMQKEWVENIPKMSFFTWVNVRRREFFQILRMK